MEIICFGLTKIEANYQASRNPGGYTFAECRPVPAGFTDDSVAEQMAVLGRARKLVCLNSQATKRLRLTALELSVCALGVRVTNFWDRKKNVHWKCRNHSATLRHLLVKIENQRKVAKRRHIRILGKTDYVATQGRWRKHIEWMRAVYVSAFKARTKRLVAYQRNAVRKICITNWVKWVQRELSTRDLAPIPEEEIKKEVQKALYAARRPHRGDSGQPHFNLPPAPGQSATLPHPTADEPARVARARFRRLAPRPVETPTRRPPRHPESAKPRRPR